MVQVDNVQLRRLVLVPKKGCRKEAADGDGHGGCLMWSVWCGGKEQTRCQGISFNRQTLFRLSFYVLCVSVFACSREKREAFRPGVARSRPKSRLVPLKGASDKIRELIFPTNLDQLQRFGKFIHFSVPSSDTPQMRFEWMNVCEHGQSMGWCVMKPSKAFNFFHCLYSAT